MAALLRLTRSDGLAWDVPAAGPGVCETCREARPVAGAAYCDRLCEAFAGALDALADAYRAEDGDRFAPAVVDARTRLRAVAIVYDATKLRRKGPATTEATNAREWAEDVAAGLLAPLPYPAAIAAARRFASG